MYVGRTGTSISETLARGAGNPPRMPLVYIKVVFLLAIPSKHTHVASVDMLLKQSLFEPTHHITLFEPTALDCA